MSELNQSPDSVGRCGARAGGRTLLDVREVSVTFGPRPILRRASFSVLEGEVFGLIGPSGAGKSTLLRCLNRLTDLSPNLRVEGEIHYRDLALFDRGTDVNALRERVGMLFQQPVVFPVSLAENVLFGARRLRRLSRSERDRVVEESLREAALWDEVKDRLQQPALSLSVGQQQRLCLARTLAVQPDVILMDEPTSALDPRSTALIEELILRLKETRTVVLVTHDVEQARRVTDWIACVCLRDGAGEVVESACCDAVLDDPQCREVIEYLGRALS